MAQVPISSSTASFVPTVMPNGLVEGNRVTADPSAFGALQAQALKGLGGSIGQAGDTMAQIALQRQQNINGVNANNALAELQKGLTTAAYGNPGDPNAAAGFMTLSGKAAVDAYGAATSDAQTARDTIANTMNPQERLMFDDDSKRLVDGQIQTFAAHAAEQQGVWQKQSYDSAIGVNTQAAVANVDNPGGLQLALNGIGKTVDLQGKVQGWTPDMTAAAKQAAQSGALVQVIKSKAVSDPTTAYNLYMSNKNSLLPTDQAEVEKSIEPQVEAHLAGEAADNVLGDVTSNVSIVVNHEASAQGVDPGLATTTAKLESGMGAHMSDPRSTAVGVYQLTNGTWAQAGGNAANRNDIGTQVKLGVQTLASAVKTTNAALGGNAQPWQSYVTFQQGAAGGPALLTAAPGANAIDVLTPIYKGNRAAAQAAILNNGGTADMTAGQFTGMWRQRYQEAAGTSSSGTTEASDDVPALPSTIAPDGAGSQPAGQQNGTYQAAVGPNSGTTQPLGTGSSQTPSGAPQAPAATPAPQTLIPQSAAAQAAAQTAPVTLPSGLTQAQVDAINVLPAPFGEDPTNYRKQVMDQASAKAKAVKTTQDAYAAQQQNDLMNAAYGFTPTGQNGPRPTALSQLLNTPAAQAAWASMPADKRAGITGILAKNAEPVDVKPTPQSDQLFYRLQAESVNDPATFQKENLLDPSVTSMMPRDQIKSLMGLQLDVAKKSASVQARQGTLSHAMQVAAPDLVSAGMNPKILNDPTAFGPSAVPAKATQAAQLQEFQGRLLDAQTAYAQSHKGEAMPDAEITATVRQLLVPGTLAGTGGWFTSRTSTTLYDAATNGKLANFRPTIPSSEQAKINAAWAARHNGQMPDAATSAQIYMRAHQSPTAPPPRPTMIRSKKPSPFAGSTAPSNSDEDAPSASPPPAQATDDDQGN